MPMPTLPNEPEQIAFQEGNITIPAEQPYEISAIVGIGTGLAYHRDGNQYAVTSLGTGKKVCDVEAITTIFNCALMNNETVLQYFIQLIAPLLPWASDEQTIHARLRAVFGTEQMLTRSFREAFEKACQMYQQKAAEAL